MVYTDGPDYYAADGTTGKIPSQSRNCTAVVSGSMSMSRESGCITFKAGIYSCNLTVSKKLCILREGRAATVIHGTIALDPTTFNDTPLSHHFLYKT